jgi:hypothetical protein
MDSYYYDEATMQALLGAYLVICAIALVLGVITIVALWKIFVKANLAGWKSIIPIYNTICLYKITWGSGWMFLTMFVPLVNFVIAIMTMHKLSKSFGKGVGFTIGLILFQPIFLLILAFGSAEYEALPSI